MSEWNQIAQGQKGSAGAGHGCFIFMTTAVMPLHVGRWDRRGRSPVGDAPCIELFLSVHWLLNWRHCDNLRIHPRCPIVVWMCILSFHAGRMYTHTLTPIDKLDALSNRLDILKEQLNVKEGNNYFRLTDACLPLRKWHKVWIHNGANLTGLSLYPSFRYARSGHYNAKKDINSAERLHGWGPLWQYCFIFPRCLAVSKPLWRWSSCY